MMFSSVLAFLFAAISLDGVVGRDLQADASLDALNVRVGDPLVLTVDFYGSADFTSIHPPALSKAVDQKVWRIDDLSAKTETYRNARRLTYRVRPLQEGAYSFPSLAFTYPDAVTGEEQGVSTESIPVHVRPGVQIALAEFEGFRLDLPQPDGLLIDLSVSPYQSGDKLTEDELFAWRKACVEATADSFRRFDFPEARLNEAACEILAGNWAKALKIYSRLEWTIGQTPAIERGILAALALKTGDANVELPMLRQVLRPLLRHALLARVLIVLAVLLAISFVLLAIRRTIRALVCLAVLLSVQGAFALDPFGESMFRQMEEMHQQMMQSAFGAGPGGFSMTLNGAPAPQIQIGVSVRPEKDDLTVGEPFNLILALEMPKGCTVSNLQFMPSHALGYSILGSGEKMTDGVPSNPSNVVRRLSVPVRYDAPFKGRVTFTFAGQWTARIVQKGRRGNSYSSTYSSSFRETTPAVEMEVKPLSEENRPDDYAGAVGSSFRLNQLADRRTVATNDVVVLTCSATYRGFLPEGAIPGAIQDGEGRVVFRRYFRATGEPRTAELSLAYFDVEAKDYRRATCPGVSLVYEAGEERKEETIVVNAAEGDSKSRLVPLRFAPRESAREIATVDPMDPSLEILEHHQSWVRVAKKGGTAGWLKKE